MNFEPRGWRTFAAVMFAPAMLGLCTGTAAAQTPPASAQPPSPAPAVEFVAAPDVALYASTDQQGEWQRLCLAPCSLAEVPFPPFALSLDGTRPVPAKNSPRTTSGTILEGQYVSRASTRSAGWVVLGVGLPIGLTAIASGAALAAAEPNNDRALTIGAGTAIGGSVAFVTSLIIGVILATRPDEAHVHVRKK